MWHASQANGNGPLKSRNSSNTKLLQIPNWEWPACFSGWSGIHMWQPPQEEGSVAQRLTGFLETVRSMHVNIFNQFYLSTVGEMSSISHSYLPIRRPYWCHPNAYLWLGIHKDGGAVGAHNLGLCMGMGMIPNSFPMHLTWSLPRLVVTSCLGEQGFAHDPTKLSTVIFTCSFWSFHHIMSQVVTNLLSPVTWLEQPLN